MAPLLIALLLVGGVTQASAQAVSAPSTPPAAASPAVQTAATPAAPDYLVGPQDVLNITVYGEPLLSGRFRVDNDGSFPYQYLNRVKAEGLTVAAIEVGMEKALGDGYLRNPQISVEVAEYRSQNVFVQGEVRSPGKYPLPGNASLMDALFLAGSTTQEAGDWLEIYHQGGGPGPTTASVGTKAADIRVRLTDVQSGKASSVNIKDGDTIFVPKAQRIYVTGQVRTGGAYRFEEGMTVFTAISLAGGVSEKGSNSRISITRLVNGQRIELPAKQEDVLKPGDQVTVKPRRL
ncbi:MAG TPA: polysaccharide biosynthesis/export family protein [Vicinamibacterales bacterium]|nr:polysaccharide biosynthesis/export family protein [Vicinamibacterales bacterium]